MSMHTLQGKCFSVSDFSSFLHKIFNLTLLHIDILFDIFLSGELFYDKISLDQVSWNSPVILI